MAGLHEFSENKPPSTLGTTAKIINENVEVKPQLLYKRQLQFELKFQSEIIS